MSLLFCDSFDHYATADINTKWTGNQVASISASGRNGTSAFYGNYQNCYMYKALPVSSSTLIAGFAHYGSSFTGSNTLVSFYDGTTAHVHLRYTTSGLVLYQGNGTVLGSTAYVVLGASWRYIELKATIADGTGGSAEVRVNGEPVITVTGVDTRNGGNASANTVYLGQLDGVNGMGSFYYDDFYVCNDQGSVNNNFLGDVRVECLRPTDNGASSMWLGSDGNSVNNYALVDEVTPNGDTDYVASANVGDVDSYTMGNLSTPSGTVYGVQQLQYARKDYSGTRGIAPVVRIGGTDYVGTNAPIGDSYLYYGQVRETSPATSTSWSILEINDAEFGVKVTS